jgi:hypothetical protein
LAAAWKGRKEVDKEVVQDLYTTATLLLSKSYRLRADGRQAEGDELAEMFLEFDRLFNEECLYDKGA